jgi:hypothetical protein
MMNSRKVFNIFSAYHKGRWVGVPVYIPIEAIGEDGRIHYFQFIPLDGQEISMPTPRRCSQQAHKRILTQVKDRRCLGR